MYDQQYANSIGIQHIHNSNTQATNNYAVTIPRIQNASLEHAEVLGAFQIFENLIFPPFPMFKIFQLPHKAKTVLKSCLEIYEINTK